MIFFPKECSGPRDVMCNVGGENACLRNAKCATHGETRCDGGEDQHRCSKLQQQGKGHLRDVTKV